MSSRGFQRLDRSTARLLTLALLLTAMFGLISAERSSATIVVVDGDWSVTGTNVYQGIIFQVDGNVTVQSGAVLEIIGGGLSFLEDSNHIYFLDIQDGGSGHGSLILDNSLLTTEPRQLSDYLKLDITVAGTLILRNGSTLKHPGTLTTTGDATLEIRDSTITGFTTEEIDDYTDLNEDDNNDAPVMYFGGDSTALVINSRIERLYENSNDVGPDSRYNITLEDQATLTVIDSYVGVDFHPAEALHNTVAAGGTSRVYLYNITMDDAQSALVSQDSWIPALGLRGTSQILTLTGYANQIGEKDTTGEPLSDITSDDGVSYTVADGERLYLEEFDAIGRWRFIGADLTLEYWTDAGWNGSSVVRYAPEGEGLRSAIAISNTGGPGGATVVSAPLTDIESFADARFMDVDFINDDGAGRSVNFDYITVDVTYELIDSQASIYLHRWIDLTVVDRFGSAVAGAGVESRVLPSGQLAYYPQNGGAAVPSAEILDYLGATAVDYNITGTWGQVSIPLLTEWINSSLYDPTMPNSHFIGNYRVRSDFSGEVDLQEFSFSPYPQVTAATNRIPMTAELVDLVWPAQDTTYVWSSPAVINYDVQLDGNLRVTSDVILQGAQLSILQGDPAAGRHYVMIEGEGSLTILGGGLGSNLPLVVYLRDNGEFFAENSQILLNTVAGRGLIYGEHSSVVTLTGGTLRGDLMALGASAALNGVNIAESDVNINASGTSYLWDPVFEGDATLALLSDDGDVGTLDFDIRNVTFDLDTEGAVAFDGMQYVQLTNVTFPGEGDWWTGRISEGAKVGMYWWIHVKAIDGLGDPVTQLSFTLERLNPNTLAFEPIPVPGPDDLYEGTYGGPEIVAPEGVILYRALAQERLASQGWSNSTYKATGAKVVGGKTYYPEAEIGASVDQNVEIELVFFNWPDLSVQESDISFLRPPVEGGVVEISVTVTNLGKADAIEAGVKVYENTTLVDNATLDIPYGTSASAILTWVPQSAGQHTLRIWALTKNDTSQNTDLDMSNNLVVLTVNVLTKPDLELRPSDYQTLTAVEDRAFTVPVVVWNTGSTNAVDFDVALYLDSVTPETLLATATGVVAPAGGNVTLAVDAGPIDQPGNYTLIVIADASGVLPEISEDNNRVEFSLEVVPPDGQVFIISPGLGDSFNLGEQVFVTGSVNTPTGQPIPGMRVTVVFRDPEMNFHDPKTVVTNERGEFQVGVQLPDEGPSGEWILSASSDAETIQAATVKVDVARVVPWYEYVVPMLNLPLWMLLGVLGAFLIVVFLVTGYMKAVGISRLVECGECGAFIPESSPSCPKCGTEFEKEMAKCSSCHAWIPMDVKRCPECDVEFTSGKAKGGEYRDRMRRQYERVVNKYRAEAQRAIGRKPSEKEFQEWWRRQPTYVTFEAWLKEEEEMRKMGSKACSFCGALNSVTASVCHKCGNLMSGKGPSGGPGRPPMPPPGGKPPQPKKAGKPVFKKILKKPFAKKK